MLVFTISAISILLGDDRFRAELLGFKTGSNINTTNFCYMLGFISKLQCSVKILKDRLSASESSIFSVKVCATLFCRQHIKYDAELLEGENKRLRRNFLVVFVTDMKLKRVIL